MISTSLTRLYGHALDGVILRNQFEEIRTAMVERTRRKSVRRQHLQKGGVIAVKDGQQMVLDKQQRATKFRERVTKASRMATKVLSELRGLVGTQETQETQKTQRL